MTEREVKRRQRFKIRRQKWIAIHGVALGLIVVMILGILFTYNKLSEEVYIEYAESSSVKYSVKIPKDAPFYSEYLEEFKEFADENGDLWIPSNYAYPTSAATVVKIDINYILEVCAPDIDYAYTYRITAQPEVVDGATKSKFPLPKTILEEETELQYENSNAILNFKKSIEIDYHYYNNLVKNFEEKMDIKNATENLIITMEVEVVGMSEILHKNSENACVIKITMPLNENAFDVNYSTTTSNCGDCKIVDSKSPEELQYLINIAKVLGALGVAILIILVIGVNITKNRDVAYYTKIQRLVNNYRSFIQKVEGGFDASSYQIVVISTFREMLAIRDTIQSPVLMSENSDKTRTQFFIPTNTRILYLFEIKVDNYDKLYKKHPDWVDDSIINVENAGHAPVANAAPAAAETAPTPAEAAPASVVNNSYSTVNNVHNNESRISSRDERRARKERAAARKAERKAAREAARNERAARSVAAPADENTQPAPVANNAQVNPQYVPVNAQPVYYVPVARNGYTTTGCKSASLCVDGQQKVVTNQGGCYPCKTTVNVMLGGCDGAYGENTVNVMTNGCQNKKTKK